MTRQPSSGSTGDGGSSPRPSLASTLATPPADGTPPAVSPRPSSTSSSSSSSSSATPSSNGVQNPRPGVLWSAAEASPPVGASETSSSSTNAGAVGSTSSSTLPLGSQTPLDLSLSTIVADAMTDASLGRSLAFGKSEKERKNKTIAFIKQAVSSEKDDWNSLLKLLSDANWETEYLNDSEMADKLRKELGTSTDVAPRPSHNVTKYLERLKLAHASMVIAPSDGLANFRINLKKNLKPQFVNYINIWEESVKGSEKDCCSDFSRMLLQTAVGDKWRTHIDRELKSLKGEEIGHESMCYILDRFYSEMTQNHSHLLALNPRGEEYAKTKERIEQQNRGRYKTKHYDEYRNSCWGCGSTDHLKRMCPLMAKTREIYGEPRRGKGQFRCAYHGYANHTTEKCNQIRKAKEMMEQEGGKKVAVNVITPERNAARLDEIAEQLGILVARGGEQSKND